MMEEEDKIVQKTSRIRLIKDKMAGSMMLTFTLVSVLLVVLIGIGLVLKSLPILHDKSLWEFLVAFYAALRFQAANGVGKAAVHHRRVAAAGLVADIQIFFQHCNAQFVARKFACNGAAHDTRTDDDHIVLFFHGIHLSS